MNRTRTVLLAAVATLACGDSNDDATSATSSTIHVRVAHLSPDAPAVDFCIREGSGSFTGPVLAGLGITSGLSYSQVTKYLDLPAGTYSARLVAPGAASCATSLAGLPDAALPALSGGTFATVAAVGLVQGTPSFTVTPLVDRQAAAPGKASLRFVHASPGTPPVDVGAGSGAAFTPLFTNVPFGAVGGGQGVDASGYLQADPLANVTVSARATGTATDALVVPGVSLAAGQAATAFAIGRIGVAETPLRVLLCPDATPASGALSACAAAP